MNSILNYVLERPIRFLLLGTFSFMFFLAWCLHQQDKEAYRVWVKLTGNEQGLTEEEWSTLNAAQRRR